VDRNSPLDDGARAAVLTMECQRGVIGDLAIFPALAAATDDADLIDVIDRLLRAARRAAIPVVHALFGFDAPPAGDLGSPLMRSAAENPILAGSPAADLAVGLSSDPTDVRITRSTGVSPFTGTPLDARLRSLGIDTVIVCGASLNVGIPGTCIEAVNLGYRVVVPTDAVVGLPADYARDVLRFTVSQLATLCRVDDLTQAWESPPR
jgi:nicotinamidase-related amidase